MRHFVVPAIPCRAWLERSSWIEESAALAANAELIGEAAAVDEPTSAFIATNGAEVVTSSKRLLPAAAGFCASLCCNAEMPAPGMLATLAICDSSLFFKLC